jgi:hypothetical protein
LVLSCFLLSTQHSVSQTVKHADVVGTVTVAPVPVALAGAIRLTLEVTAEAPLAVEPVTFAAPPGWRLRGADEPVLDEPSGGRQRWRQTFRLTPDRPGELALPPPAVRVRSGGRETPVVLEWPPLPVPVTTSLPRAELDEARGVTGPEPAPALPPSPLRDWLIAAAVLASLAVTFWLVWRRRHRPRPLPEPPPVEWALRALDRLGGRDPTDPTAADDLADLLRGFLSRRHNLAADGRTTAEVLVLLRQSPLPSDAAAGWQVLLERCDLARFARFGFAPDEWPAVLARVRELVTATLPVGELAGAALSSVVGEKA